MDRPAPWGRGGVPMTPCTSFPVVDEVIERFAGALGGDRVAYRNHVTRVLNYFQCLMSPGDGCPREVLLVGAFHDLGIWAEGTFDYIGPSVRLAREHLASADLGHLAREVEAVIVWHHKLSRYRGEFASSVETFRRADLVDVSLGRVRFGVPGPFVRAVRETLPNAGFHRRLVALQARQLLQHPLHPLPMVRW